MLTQLTSFNTSLDGRYATDAELQLLDPYLTSFDLRLSAYLKLQTSEVEIVRDTEARVRAVDPHLLMRGMEDFQTKWTADTVRVLRYSALAMLVDDPERHKDRILYWFQTLMRAFKVQRSCDVTYRAMQEVVKIYLSPAESSLFCPILEINRTLLGTAG